MARRPPRREGQRHHGQRHQPGGAAEQRGDRRRPDVTRQQRCQHPDHPVAGRVVRRHAGGGRHQVLPHAHQRAGAVGGGHRDGTDPAERCRLHAHGRGTDADHDRDHRPPVSCLITRGHEQHHRQHRQHRRLDPEQHRRPAGTRVPQGTAVQLRAHGDTRHERGDRCRRRPHLGPVRQTDEHPETDQVAAHVRDEHLVHVQVDMRVDPSGHHRQRHRDGEGARSLIGRSRARRIHPVILDPGSERRPSPSCNPPAPCCGVGCRWVLLAGGHANDHVGQPGHVRPTPRRS